MALLKEACLRNKRNGSLRRYWDRRKLEQEAEESKDEATMQAAINSKSHHDKSYAVRGEAG
jgi:hypothetical protein